MTHTIGTTSACAENTDLVEQDLAFMGNYLRVRGEYGANLSQYTDAMELPPRARRIPVSALKRMAWEGTTSACAENTLPPPSQHSKPRNYLRVRGEYG